jgi:alpha-glucan,water dikinase
VFVALLLLLLLSPRPFPSVPVVPLDEVLVDAAHQPLMWDPDLRGKLLDTIVDAGQAIEAAFDGVPQDVEGVWQGGQLSVVQARPQVMHN